MAGSGEGYSKAPNGSCKVCQLPPEKRYEAEARIIRGDTWEDIAALTDCSWMTVNRHMQNGHVQIEAPRIREWMQKHGTSPARALEKARTKALEHPEKVSQEMINATLLSLAQRGLKLLDAMENDEDYRGSVQAIESLRRTAMDLATMNNLRGQDQKQETDSVDVQALKASILEAVGKGKPDGWQPLR